MVIWLTRARTKARSTFSMSSICDLRFSGVAPVLLLELGQLDVAGAEHGRERRVLHRGVFGDAVDVVETLGLPEAVEELDRLRLGLGDVDQLYAITKKQIATKVSSTMTTPRTMPFEAPRSSTRLTSPIRVEEARN